MFSRRLCEFDRRPNSRGCGTALYREVMSFRSVMEPKETPHARLTAVKVQSAHMPFAIMVRSNVPSALLRRSAYSVCVATGVAIDIVLQADAVVCPGCSSIHAPKMLGDATGEVIQNDGVWRVYEFTWRVLRVYLACKVGSSGTRAVRPGRGSLSTIRGSALKCL